MDKETYNKTKRYLKSVAEHEERCQILAKEFQESNSDELKEALNKEQKELLQKLEDSIDGKSSPKRKKFFDTLKEIFD